ncbi:hypothetical protein [Gulosibacter bifidus]|uniref:Lipoprotein n=1 Tax=Gulosibacter bifidus TaxID=272239 RepID=A0ABW5RJP1_9MICO|nr:hypothetical protein [Gulosibacter bifidus]
MAIEITTCEFRMQSTPMMMPMVRKAWMVGALCMPLLAGCAQQMDESEALDLSDRQRARMIDDCREATLNDVFGALSEASAVAYMDKEYTFEDAVISRDGDEYLIVVQSNSQRVDGPWTLYCEHNGRSAVVETGHRPFP